jgi:hypothetical protein
MRRIMLAAFGNAKLGGSGCLRPQDISDERSARKPRIGF